VPLTKYSPGAQVSASNNARTFQSAFHMNPVKNTIQTCCIEARHGHYLLASKYVILVDLSNELDASCLCSSTCMLLQWVGQAATRPIHHPLGRHRLCFVSLGGCLVHLGLNIKGHITFSAATLHSTRYASMHYCMLRSRRV